MRVFTSLVIAGGLVLSGCTNVIGGDVPPVPFIYPRLPGRRQGGSCCRLPVISSAARGGISAIPISLRIACVAVDHSGTCTFIKPRQWSAFIQSMKPPPLR